MSTTDTAQASQVMPDTQPLSKFIDSTREADRQLLVLGQNEALLKKMEASLNQKIQKLRDEFETNTRNYVDQNTHIVEELEAFSTAHRHLFDGKKTLELTHGTIGFRTSPPKLLTLKKFTWKMIIDLFRKSKKFSGFIRSKEEVDKEAVHTAYAAQELSDKDLAAVGIFVDQKDEFIYQIKWEELAQ